MSVEIIGTNKILKYLERYDFKKIKLSRGSEPVYLKRSTDTENKESLIADFQDWIDEFIEPDNFKEYKLELFGTYSQSPDAKLSPIVKVTVAFNSKATVTGTPEVYAPKVASQSPNMDLDKYVSMAVELATVRAQNERLEEKLDELLDEIENPEEIGTPDKPKNIGEAVQEAIIGKADKIIDALLIYFANSNSKPVMSTPAPAINGIDSPVLEEFKSIYPDIEEDLARLLVLAKTKPDFFKMLINQLRAIV